MKSTSALIHDGGLNNGVAALSQGDCLWILASSVSKVIIAYV